MKKTGIGYGCIFYGTGYGNGFPDESRAVIELKQDGKFILYVASIEVGQGATNVMHQVAAETLGVTIEDVKVVCNNTNETKDSGTAAASRQTYNTGNAVQDACLKMRENINKANANNANLALTYEIMKNNKINTKEEGYFKARTSTLDKNGQGDPYWPYAFGAQRVTVEVDDETGKVDIIEVIACHDVGKAINPMMVEAQIQGGCAMGIGYALMEEVEFSNGQIKNKNFSNYIMPTSMDIPNINSYIMEDEEITGPFGAKGLGEPSLVPTAPAILNAIYDAVGIRLTTLPATCDRVLCALKEKLQDSKGVK